MSGQGVIGDGPELTMSGCGEATWCVRGRRQYGWKVTGCVALVAGCGLRVIGDKQRERDRRFGQKQKPKHRQSEPLTMHESASI
jgi:hypothetical protein